MRGPRTVLPLLLALSLAVRVAQAGAAEVCRYGGTGDYDATIGIVTIAQQHGGTLRLDVLWDLRARAFAIFHIHYRVEEVSDWSGGVLRRVGLNVRSFVNGRIVRQQWDLFDRTPIGFAAWRAQAKTAQDFAARHAAFARHWDPDTFGQPWLDDYAAARPERRPDLDLRADEAPASLVPPFAAAFYLVRTEPPGPRAVALFLPGNKHQHRADLAIPPPAAAPGGGRTWQVRLDSERLGIVPGSVAYLTVTPAGVLQTIRFTVATSRHSAEGVIVGQGCTGRADAAR